MMPPVSGNTALFLDIDGTLLDLARTPDRVKVPHELPRAWKSCRTSFRARWPLSAAVRWRVSTGCSRPSAPPPSAPMAGKSAGADGMVARSQPLPDSVRDIFVGLASTIPGLLLEDKKCALALHYRLAPEAQPVLASAMEKHAKLFEAEKVHILHGKAVIEARPSGVDKGTAVAALAKQKPFAGRAILFGGDDTTDLDVFRILPRLGGRGFSVGKRFPGAEHVFDSPRAVRQWLARAGRWRWNVR